MKKVRSRQAAILVLNRVKHSFSLRVSLVLRDIVPGNKNNLYCRNRTTLTRYLCIELCEDQSMKQENASLREIPYFKATLKAFDDFKNKQQKCIKYYLFICKSMYILKVYEIHYTM